MSTQGQPCREAFIVHHHCAPEGMRDHVWQDWLAAWLAAGGTPDPEAGELAWLDWRAEAQPDWQPGRDDSHETLCRAFFLKGFDAHANGRYG